MTDIITILHPENDADTNLYPNIKKENIPDGAVDLNKLDASVISFMGSLKPSGVDTSANILAKTSDEGIWVGSDTGNWYYWNGTQYVDGGVYQATQIGNNQIEINNLTSKFRNIFRNISIENNFKFSVDIATIDSYTNFNMVNFVADAGDTLVFKRSIFEQNFNILATYEDGTTAILVNMYTNISLNGITKTYGEVTLSKKVIALGINKPSGSELHCEIEIIPIKYFNANEFNESITILSNINMYFDLIKCNYKIGDILLFDITENEDNIINILGVTDNNVNKILLNNYKSYNNILILEDNIKYLGIRIGNGHTNTFNYKVIKIDKDIYKLSGLKYGALGDSITVGYQADNRSYAYYASKELYLNFTNYGISGNRLAVDSPDDPAEPMCIRYADMADDLDIITVMGGTNDCASQAPIGTNTDTTNATFKGGLNILIKGLLNKYVGKKIGFITPTQRYYQNQWINNEKQETYVNAMIEMCSLYSIPCLDLYHCGGITTKVDSNANGLLADGLHPSTAGQKVLTNKVVEFIKSL